MYLKRLDILGFKSFANKTTVNFSTGITAIVGPNGCGKTNILDSLRWVLGEQKVSMLRGSKMEEVIFNGTRDMKALGMSEVTLSLVNNRGVLPTEYTEVQITRRLFRSGESEYLLNKVPCRLKDITELFYDTGMGAHSYSVIQQDMIEAVISDKAEERRFLFEEAAGITKYKQRKKAALRKLEATENDFLRLNDIYSEVQTQVRSLKRQQSKAERYQQVANQIKDWDLYLNSVRVKAVEQERREQRARLDQLTDQMSGYDTQVDSLSSALESDRGEQIDIEHELTRVGNEAYELSEKAHSLEKEISILHEKKANASSLIERNESDIKALEGRSEVISEQAKEAESSLEFQKQELGKIDGELRRAEETQSEADRRLLMARSSKEQDNRKLIELEGKLSSGKTEEDNLRSQEEELTQSLESYRNQITESQTTRQKLIEDRDLKKRQLDEAVSAKHQAEKSYADLGTRLEELVGKNEDLAEEISNLTASIEACEARKTLLEDMIVHYEGYESGIKAVMEARERWSGVLGTVAEKFVPNAGLEVAVEAALGEIARFLICDSRSTAESIISYLKSENKGRIGILVPDSGTITPAVKRPELDVPGFVGWLDTLVGTEEQLRPLMQAILSRTAVFVSGFSPDQILERLPYGFQAVSKSGEVYSKNIISGGSDDKFPLFRRREKVAEQEQMADEFRRQLVSVREARNKVTADIGASRAELGQLTDRIEELGEQLSEAQQRHNEAEYQFRGLETELARLEKERKHLNDKREVIRNRQYSLGLDFNQLATQKQSLVAEMTQSSEKLSDLEGAAADAVARVSHLQVRLVEARSKVEQIESKIAHLTELRDEMSTTRESKQQEIEQARHEIQTSASRVDELEIELKATFESRQEINARQSKLHEVQSEILEKVTAKEKQLKEARTGKDSLNAEMHKIDIRLNTLESEARSIVEKISEEYETDIRTVETTNPDPNMPEEESRTHLQNLKEQLKKFGAVNLLALEEYKTASEREIFLKEQLEDLRTAKNDLQSTITRINQTARQLFLDTFNQVKVNFQNLFVELFAGGEADINLIDPSDPLESDIEIIARPRGKKILSITMMSGGERALTAISLLFSLYLVKPSPFCILDEIDAPLDDANCHRFLRIIRKFSEQTQFIIITHNKISMEAAQNLYGVTMEQFGISKLVAVKFTDNGPDDEDEEVVLDTEAGAEEEAEPDEAVVSALEVDDSGNGNGNGNGNGSKEGGDSTDHAVFKEPLETVEPESSDPTTQLDDLPPRVVERFNVPVIDKPEDDSGDND